MEETVQYPRFISNGPCGEDLFAGKAHQRIAEEIAQQLLQPDAPPDAPHNVPHVIGLDGGWGAGKSNIIEIIKSNIQKEKGCNVLFFTYNAWGHQGDPLRRSILEELTRCVVSSDSALAGEKETWEEKLKTLTSQRKEVSTKTFPKLSAGIIVFLLVIPLTPVFNAIARALPAFLNQWTEGIVTATPILLALIYAVTKMRCKLLKLLRMLFNRKMRCKFRRKKMNSRKEKKRSSSESFLSKLFYLYNGGVQETETHEEVYSSEASSTQFKDWISKLDEALKARLVIVIDDMDRLPARNVQELWAAIHTLFTEVKYERIKVIVPFDRSHIISAFREENIQGKDSTPKCYGNDFIDKTFDAVYRVAPPILSNWKTYLNDRWNEAFGKEPEGLVTQIYDLLADGKTPREIIAFINECVTIRKTCSPEIPDEYIALFAVGKHAIVQDPQCELLELKFCQPLSYRYDNEETRKYLSAIHYQLEPDNALETIYVDQLRRELDKGESTLLQRLITKSIFTSILEHAIAEITHVENATMAFRAVEENTAIPQNFWDELVQKGMSIRANSNEPVVLSNALQALLNYSSASKSRLFLDFIIDRLYTECRIKDDSSSKPDFYAWKFHVRMRELCNVTKELGLSHLQPLSRLHVEYASPAYYIQFVIAARDQSERYKIRCNTDTLNRHIINTVNEADPLYQESADLDRYYDSSPEDLQDTYLYRYEITSLINATTSAEEAEMLFERWVEYKLTTEGALLSEKQIAQFITEAKRGSLLYNCTICQLIVRGGSKDHPEINAVLEEENDELVHNTIRANQSIHRLR